MKFECVLSKGMYRVYYIEWAWGKKNREVGKMER